MTMLPGPVSKSNTSPGRAPAGMTVRLAMPPTGVPGDHRGEAGSPPWDQRRAFTTGRHVGRTKIGYDRRPYEVRDHSRLADLQGARS